MKETLVVSEPYSKALYYERDSPYDVVDGPDPGTYDVIHRVSKEVVFRSDANKDAEDNLFEAHSACQKASAEYWEHHYPGQFDGDKRPEELGWRKV